MFSYDMSKAGANNLYRYLYQCIKKDIVSKKFEPGEQIPSKRSLAINLGVSVVTVENAYAQLLAEGYIYSLPKKGFFVSNIAFPNLQEHSKIKRKRLQKFEDPEKISKKYIADFASNSADLEGFPFSTWAKITREVLIEKQKELLQSSPGMGILELREAISKMLREFRNIHVSPKQIVVGAGTDYLYGLLVQLLGFDKIYVVEDPGYAKISKLYEKLGVKIQYTPVESSDFIKALNNANADVVHLSPSHHFPTGRVMPIQERYRLLSWASESESRYIIEDDYDSEFRMKGLPISSLQNIDVTNKVIYLNTFSKTMTSAIRLSYMVLPENLAKKFNDEFEFYSCTVSNLEQYVMAEFIHRGFFENHINRMRNLYRGKRDILLSCIKKSSLNHLVKIREEDAGLHFVLEVDTKLSDREFCRRAAQNGVRIRALSEYYFKETPSEHKFIINYSSVEKKNMGKAIAALEKVL